jgi:hypothetical protein
MTTKVAVRRQMVNVYDSLVRTVSVTGVSFFCSRLKGIYQYVDEASTVSSTNHSTYNNTEQEAAYCSRPKSVGLSHTYISFITPTSDVIYLETVKKQDSST